IDTALWPAHTAGAFRQQPPSADALFEAVEEVVEADEVVRRLRHDQPHSLISMWRRRLSWGIHSSRASFRNAPNSLIRWKKGALQPQRAFSLERCSHRPLRISIGGSSGCSHSPG